MAGLCLRVRPDEIDEASLLALPVGATVEIAPSPPSWARLKPLLYRFLAQHGRGARPRLYFSGVPACAFGTEHAMIRLLPEPGRADHPPCRTCRVRPRCNPPASFGSELAPFGAGDPLVRLRHYLTALGGREESRELAMAVVTAMREVSAPSTPFLLEPSVHLEPDLARSVRLAVFFGELPADRVGGHREGIARLEAAASALRIALPAALRRTLSDHGPFPMPIGLELTEGERPLLKLYVRMERAGPDALPAKGALVRALLDLAGAEVPSDDLVARTGMVAVGVEERGVVELKAYVRGDPSRGEPSLSLPPLEPDDPLLSLAEGAYAVTDLHARRPRPPKWDLRTRGRLLTGSVAARVFGEMVPASRAALEALFVARGGLVAVVAVAVRDGRITLYFELC